MIRASVLLLWVAVGCRADATHKPIQITVFAAASMTDVARALADSFEHAQSSYRVTVATGATSLLARQIVQGAPADVFMAASPVWMDYLNRHNEVQGSSDTVATNQLVVIGASGAPRLKSSTDVAGARRLAIADPAHVPAGVYAQQALECSGLWESVAPNVIPTLNVRAAAAAVQVGAAELAVVYATDVSLVPELAVLMEWPANCAPRIVHTIATLTRARNTGAARSFVDFALSPDNRAVWLRYGFGV